MDSGTPDEVRPRSHRRRESEKIGGSPTFEWKKTA